MYDYRTSMESIRQKLSISEVISSFLPLKRHGHEWMACCPFHHEKTPSFTINDAKGFYHCFGCGAHGDMLEFLVKQQNLAAVDALQWLAAKAGIQLITKASNPDFDPSLYDVMEEVSNFYKKSLYQNKTAFNYLLNRKIHKISIEKFNLGWAPSSLPKEFDVKKLEILGLLSGAYPKFRNRIIFPITNIRNKVIAFGGRVIGSGEPKYLNSPQTILFNKGTNLYGLAQSPRKQLLIVEGYLDVIQLHQHGIDSAVAPLGTALTPEQLLRIWQYDHEPICCFDGDTAGYKAAFRAARTAIKVLKPGQSLRFMFLPEGNDPDGFLLQHGADEFRLRMEKSKPLVEVLWQDFISSINLDTPEEKALSQQALQRFLSDITSEQVKYFYQQEFKLRLKNIIFPPRSNTRKQILSSPKPIIKSLGEKILLVALINHPKLIQKVEDKLLALELTPEIEHIRNAILAGNFIPEDVFQDIPWQNLLIYAPFIHPSHPDDQTLVAWIEIWQRQEQEKQKKSALDRIRSTLVS